MESLKKYTNNLKNLGEKALVTAGLVCALTLWPTSCSKPTPKDVIEQQQEVEVLGYRLRSYINSRKTAVKKYNKLDAYPQNESNQYSIEIVKAQLYKDILWYNEEIESLAQKKLKAERKVSEISAECVSGTTRGPLDENKYDYLLNF